jgi:hypothetical protein
MGRPSYMRSVDWNVVMWHMTVDFMKKGCPWHNTHTMFASAAANETNCNSKAYYTDKDSAAKSIWTSTIVLRYTPQPDLENVLRRPILVTVWRYISGKGIKTEVKWGGEENLGKDAEERAICSVYWRTCAQCGTVKRVKQSHYRPGVAQRVPGS